MMTPGGGLSRVPAGFLFLVVGGGCCLCVSYRHAGTCPTRVCAQHPGADRAPEDPTAAPQELPAYRPDQGPLAFF